MNEVSQDDLSRVDETVPGDYIVITPSTGDAIMKTRLVRIGNSRGVRLPKPLIEQAGLHDEVELEVRHGAIVITPADGPRKGWEEAAKQMAQRREDDLIDTEGSRFDEEEWHW